MGAKYCMYNIRFKVDVIVNTTSKDLKLSNGGVSAKLVAKAGQSVQEECTKHAPSGLPLGQIVGTSPGLLACKAIYHGACADYNAKDSQKASSIADYPS